MPIMKCVKDGKSGYKYGDGGHCYTGPGAKDKALKQMRAIKVNSTMTKAQKLLNAINEVLKGEKKPDSDSPSKNKKEKKGEKKLPWMKK